MDVSPSPKEKCLEWAVSLEPAQLQLQLSSEAGEAPLHCVGSLQVQRQLQLGFICGSLPVPTDNDAMTCKTSSIAEAAIIPAISLQNDRIMAPRYRMLPNQTDLNTLLLSEVEHEQILPITSGRAPEGVHELCKTWGNSYHTQPLARKCEALAVSALAGNGDQIDIIAPVEILKKIFKIPYSKARLSIAVHRVGQTLILTTGPDVEEGENLVRTKKNQAKALEKSLFLKFAMQSVRAEACDCPVSHNSEGKSPSNFTSESFNSESSSDFEDGSLDQHAHVGVWQYMVDDVMNKKKRTNGSTKSLNAGRRGPQNDQKQRVSWSSSDRSSFPRIDSLKKSSIVGEQQRDPDCIRNDSGNHKRPSSEDFLRVLFWQLEEMRMLLGSDLLLFSNEKHVAVSLHLWEMEQQVTPVMWLDAWLDNVMASVPELAICYHHNGIVQGYELLKTDDIFLLKGLSEDGTSFFHPHAVQQNALSVLRFLQENCKQDLGTYWLFKNAGEDLVQLFDLSVISKNCSATTKKDEKKESLSSSWGRGKGSCSLPLGILLYRLAHRLSLSQDPSDRCRCASFFKKCLELLGEQEHLFVRASAHEHVARLILKCHEELGSMLMPFFLEANEHNDGAPRQPVLEHLLSSSESLDPDTRKNKSPRSASTFKTSYVSSDVETSVTVSEYENHSFEREYNVPTKEAAESCRAAETDIESGFAQADHTSNAEKPPQTLNSEAVLMEENSSEMDITGNYTNPPTDLANSMIAPVSARLAAVHHVSQAIKALRWQRQLQDVEGKVLTSESKLLGSNRYVHLVPVCVYGEIDCIEYCDIRECEIGPFMDQKLLQLVLLLGESYLSLGQAYKDDGQLNWALKAAELACSVYESMPLHWNNKGKHTPYDQKRQWIQVPTLHPSNLDIPKPPTLWSKSTSQTFCQPIFHDSDTGKYADKGLFWGQAWILVGDIYVEYQRVEKNGFSDKEASKCDGLAMAQEVAKEVKRLRKKLSQSRKNCTVCSLVSCSCQSDRVSSGNSASSSSSSGTTIRHARKHGKKGNAHAANITFTKHAEEDLVVNHENGLSNVEGNLKANFESAGQPFKQRITLQSGNHKAHTSPEILMDKPGTNVDLSIGTFRSEDSDTKQRRKGDIFSFLQGPSRAGREMNLLDAVECYDAAVLTLTEMWQGSEEMKSAFRKKGWTCNEIGRMKLACGDMKAAEAVFEKAISAFKDVKDQTNVVLIYCNIGHGQRAAAEALVSQLDSWKGAALYEQVSKQIFDDAVSQYIEALRVYGIARNEMKFLSEDFDSETVNLRNEVLTQCAHTHLRLGMLLAREENYRHPDLKVSADNRHTESSGCESVNSQTPRFKKISMTANDAIREAIALYESLGSLRAQELAFAQFQLACHHRDCCLATIKSEGKRYTETTSLQQSKRYLSLADRYWLKALKYYRSTTHPDMFLEILMQRSALNVAVTSSSYSVSMLEVALSHLLEGRHVRVSATAISSTHDQSGQECLKPSDRVLTKFSQQLQTLLRTMLAAAQNMQKGSSHKNLTGQTRNHKSMDSNNKGIVHRSEQVGDVVKLKEMYRLALKSTEVPDLQRMYDMWLS